MATVAVMRELSDDQLADLNEVYHEVLKDQGKPVVDLKVRSEVPIATNAESTGETKTAAAPAAAKANTKKKGQATAKPAASSGTPIYIALAVIFLAGGAGVAYMFTRKAKSHKKLMPVPAGDSVFASNSPDIVIAAAPPAAKPRPRPAATGASPAASTTTSRAAGTRPANPAAGVNPAAAKPAAPKPRPKPPAPE